MRPIHLLILLMAIGALSVAPLAELPKAAEAAETVVLIGGDDTVEEPKSDGISRRQRRKLGITFRNIRSVAKEMKAEGELSDDPSVAAVQVLDKLTEQHPKAYAEEAPSLDWDKLLEIVERLLAIIMRFF